MVQDPATAAAASCTSTGLVSCSCRHSAVLPPELFAARGIRLDAAVAASAVDGTAATSLVLALVLVWIWCAVLCELTAGPVLHVTIHNRKGQVNIWKPVVLLMLLQYFTPVSWAVCSVDGPQLNKACQQYSVLEARHISGWCPANQCCSMQDGKRCRRTPQHLTCINTYPAGCWSAPGTVLLHTLAAHWSQMACSSCSPGPAQDLHAQLCWVHAAGRGLV